MSSFAWLRSRRSLVRVLAGAVVAVALVAGSAVAVQAVTTRSFTTTRNSVRCTGPGTSAAKALAKRVQDKVGPALRATGVRIAFAVDDTATGVRCTERPSSRFDSASIVKVAIVAALLDIRHRQGRALSSTEKSWARAAITRSDNSAASALYARIGRVAGLQTFFSRAGMEHATPNLAWGLTKVTAPDELTLLRRVTRAGLLADTDRRYLQGLMTSVVSSQRWGVPAGAPSGARVGNKNGWLSHAGSWRVHSIGWVRTSRTTYDLVLLSDGNGTYARGRERLNAVARAVHTAMRR